MTPLGFSGGSHDRLSVSAVERIRWTVGTADGAADWTTETVSVRQWRANKVGKASLLSYTY